MKRTMFMRATRFIVGALLLMASGSALRASAPPDEGMWLPMFVDRLNYVDMQEMGLQLTPEEIYSINNSSIKDAIVGLSGSPAPSGFFCSAEVVSDKGLIFTNHHCGYDVIQKHSSIEHDYLKDGFWAMSLEEELPNENLTATFLVKMDDVTDSIIPFLSDTLDSQARSAKIREISGRLKNAATEDGKYHVVVKSFFEGNEYYRFVYVVYRDVRLVGAPPSAIGKFGGDVDNWMWPRHTGDFSIFRIYSGPDGEPADYSKDNVPLKPKHHLPVSLDGREEGEFTMIWGYPGSTDRYLTSYGVKNQIEYFNPTVINVLGKKLEVWKEHMDNDREVAIKYASKYSGLANFWKYSIGQNKGLKRLDVYGQKQLLEERFTDWVEQDPERKEIYGEVLPGLKDAYGAMGPAFVPLAYNIFGGGQGAEILSLPQQFTQFAGMLEEKAGEENLAPIRESLSEDIVTHFKDYDAKTDQDLLAAMLKMYYEDLDEDLQPEYFLELTRKYKEDFDAIAAYIFEKSFFDDQAELVAFVADPKLKKLRKDPAYELSLAFQGKMMESMGAYRAVQGSLGANERLFMAGLREMMTDHAFYPNANSTMRFTYGSVQDYGAADAVHYDYVTHLYGVMEKEDPGSEEFTVPDKLKELYHNKDYGPYGENGKMVVCFLSTNDITGGNSGSPVLNAHGDLIGIAFDGNWEAMSGDIAYEPKLQRTINVDIRYVLFIIDKFAGAQNLIDELTIAPKRVKETADAKTMKETEKADAE